MSVSDEDFASYIESQVAPQEETPTEEETAPVVEETPQAAEEPEAPAVEETPEEPEGPQFNEDVQAYLSKYGGSVEKALEAALHAQAKLGEQGNELGELRRMVQELYERPEPTTPASPFVPPQVQEAILENPSAVVQWAEQNNQPQVFEAAMREWFEQDAWGASAYREQKLLEAVAGVVQQNVEPAITHVNERESARRLTEAYRTLTAKYPDFQQVLESATPDEVAEIPRDLLAKATQDNPQAALELMYRWVAMGRGQRAAQAQEQRTNEVREQKRQAAVVTQEETTMEAVPKTAVEMFKESLLEPDPWSVAHGLNR